MREDLKKEIEALIESKLQKIDLSKHTIKIDSKDLLNPNRNPKGSALNSRCKSNRNVSLLADMLHRPSAQEDRIKFLAKFSILLASLNALALILLVLYLFS